MNLSSRMYVFTRRWSVGLAAMLLCTVAHAANPADWWVDIANDRVSNVKTALARGADPNELSPKGQPAIMQAIRDGAWGVYDVLAANRKTALNAININRETPLMYLAVLGQTKRAQDLIRRGAMVNRLGWTPLQYAASTGKLETAKMLIANKAIVNAPAPDGTTALMMAAHSGSEAMVRLLLDHGADVTTQNLQKLDAADWAINNKHDALAATLQSLIDKTLKQRAAARQQGDTAAPEGADDASGVKTIDLGDVDAGAAPAQRDAPEKEQDKPASTSPYFDLERFK